MEQSTPIYEVPEVQEKVKAVRKYIDTLCRSLNLFAWRQFIDDLKADIELEIYKYEDLYRQGKYKQTGIGAYCNMAKQGALNYRAFYDAKKRKAEFEALSLDALYETEKGAAIIQVADPKSDDLEQFELSLAVEQTFGVKARQIVDKLFNGGALTSAELIKLRTPEFKLFLQTLKKA